MQALQNRNGEERSCMTSDWQAELHQTLQIPSKDHMFLHGPAQPACMATAATSRDTI